MARDFSIHYEKMGHSPPQKKQIKRQLTQEQRYLQAEIGISVYWQITYTLLKQWKEEYAPKQMEDVWHPLFNGKHWKEYQKQSTCWIHHYQAH